MVAEKLQAEIAFEQSLAETILTAESVKPMRRNPRLRFLMAAQAIRNLLSENPNHPLAILAFKQLLRTHIEKHYHS